MENKCRPLIYVLSEISDFRKSKGKRHPLSAILALACASMMCKSYRAFAEWGRNYGREFMKALGFTHEDGPCAATFSIIFRKIKVELEDRRMGREFACFAQRT